LTLALLGEHSRDQRAELIEMLIWQSLFSLTAKFKWCVAQSRLHAFVKFRQETADGFFAIARLR
jgi:hypothetical protein